MKNIIYFRGGRKGEEVFLDDRYYEFGVGGIISDLLDMNVQRAISRFEAMKREILYPIITHECPVQRLEKIPGFISASKMTTSSFLQSLLLWQPLIMAQAPAVAKQAEYEFTAQEQRQVLGNNLPPYVQQQLGYLRKESSLRWNVFAGLLKNEVVMSVESDCEHDEIIRCTKTYLNNWEEMLLSLQRLQSWLTGSLTSDVNYESSGVNLIYAGLQSRPIPSREMGLVFSDRPGTKYTVARTAIRINDLIAWELELMEENGQRFSQCGLCGRYFVPFSSKAIYCHNPNPNYDGKPCSKIGPVLAHRSNIWANPLYSRFLRARKTYAKWCSENCRKRSREIEKEILSTRMKWENTAAAALADYAVGMITKEAVEQALMLPAIQERSPLLYEAKKESIDL